MHNECLTWNEFQSENAGKYTNEEMSAAWADYKMFKGGQYENMAMAL